MTLILPLIKGGPNTVTIRGPMFKDGSTYLSSDGHNPEAPRPGYGWPLGSECWYFYLEGSGARRWATGLTVESAWNRAVAIANGEA